MEQAVRGPRGLGWALERSNSKFGVEGFARSLGKQARSIRSGPQASKMCGNACLRRRTRSRPSRGNVGPARSQERGFALVAHPGDLAAGRLRCELRSPGVALVCTPRSPGAESGELLGAFSPGGLGSRTVDARWLRKCSEKVTRFIWISRRKSLAGQPVIGRGPLTNGLGCGRADSPADPGPAGAQSGSLPPAPHPKGWIG